MAISWQQSSAARRASQAQSIKALKRLEATPGGWSELLSYWYILAGLIALAYLVGVPGIIIGLVLYFGVGFTAKGFLAQLIIALGKQFSSGVSQRKDPLQGQSRAQSSASIQERLKQYAQSRESLGNDLASSGGGGQYYKPNVTKIASRSADRRTMQALKADPAAERSIIDRSSNQNMLADVLTWLLFLVLICFSALLVWAGYNTDYFEPVGFITSPIKAIYYGSMGLAVTVPIFLYLVLDSAKRNQPTL